MAMREQPNITKSIVVAVLAVAAACGARFLLDPLLGDGVPFITFFPASFAVAWWGGLRPAVLVTLLSAFALPYENGSGLRGWVPASISGWHWAL